MKKTGWIVLLYGLLVCIGGVIGYVHSGSFPSLLSGSLFGLALIGSSILVFRKKSPGYWAALALAIGLEGFFTWRFAKTLHFFPSGLFSLLSLVVIIIVALKIRKARLAR